MRDELRLLGTTDIARLLGVTRQAVAHRQTHDPTFPAPLGAVNATERTVGVWVWRAADVEVWADCYVKGRRLASGGATRPTMELRRAGRQFTADRRGS